MKNFIQKIKKSLKRKIDEKDITIEEMEELRKSGLTILDVRSKQEYQEGHIDGAISLPEYEINREITDKILPDKKENIMVYCSTGKRSKKAKGKLERLGYKNIYNLYEGF